MSSHQIPRALLILGISMTLSMPAVESIRPWSGNPFYWQLDGQPVLLLGGSSEDNLFQQDEALSELERLAAAGGNYVRNTMSDRDAGNLRAFHRRSDGQYDLTRWNDAYWTRFDAFLRRAEELGIVVGIEVWDRFDHSRSPWDSDPWNPENTVTYTSSESGLATSYPNHPGTNQQPFFYTVPALDDNRVVLPHQRRFVDKLLGYTLPRSNVLYCMDNETSGAPEWGAYWADHIRAKADAAGRRVNLTEMWDQRDVTGSQHRHTLDHPERYDFSDISQNTHNNGQTHWDGIMQARAYLLDRGRRWPLDTTKIYGADGGTHGGSSDDAIEKFWRQIVGGVAVSRFHRPTSGIGGSEPALRAIRAARMLETRLKLWDLAPRQDLLRDRGSDEAYLAADPGRAYALYFTNGGSVGLDLSAVAGSYELRWIDADDAVWGATASLSGGGVRSIGAPGGGDWVAAIVRSGAVDDDPPATPGGLTAEVVE